MWKSDPRDLLFVFQLVRMTSISPTNLGFAIVALP